MAICVDGIQGNNDLEDEILIDKIHNGDSESLERLIFKYKNFVRSRSSKYFLIGGDREDIVQEGMIGLYKAIRDYQKGKIFSFLSFADMCIKRQMITAVKHSTRQKHKPLNSYLSLDKPVYEEDDSVTFMDLIPGTSNSDPMSLVLNKEKDCEFKLKLNKLLSELERKVLSLYLDGQSYVEMSKELNTHVKSVDNALQRVKRKIEGAIDINSFVNV
ncbi:RNA polymerase sporulation sigma factor SigH [Neobacillus cucumis]|uniref:RNA polymerase sporulation sigma factor SigH n=1 Tax=Neobacillus cucumis TaxID=1740721 RepID=UPI0028536FEB|nr:RNA polymerase sporulation sigma factor SigH [Neobacillus cucumis]MDR4950372.1 RNA polymerase sporulation sigma factor SigH [Neobacillus cucumis]